MRVTLFTLNALLCASTLAFAQDRTKADRVPSFSVNVYHASGQMPAEGPVPLVLEIENHSPDAHKLFAGPIFFATRSADATAPPHARVTLPANSDIFIEVLVERIDPVGRSPA